MNLRTAQRAIWRNKKSKRFNTTDVPLEICLLQGEVAELFDAWRKKQPTVGEELADVAIYLLGLAQMLDVDLESEIIRKMAINQHRTYVKRNGVLVKTPQNEPEPEDGADRTAEPETTAQPEALVLPLQFNAS
jgi:NTP pyrophosphatase (non-canonical NTP hydrolase)